MRYIIHKYLRFSIITAFIVCGSKLYRTKNWTKFELVDPFIIVGFCSSDIYSFSIYSIRQI
jgi:hypothetical protein